MQSSSTFSSLPIDIQYLIFTYLNPVELCIVSQVNSTWKRLSVEDTIWKQLCRRDFQTDVLLKETDNQTWKQQYKSWSSSVWGEKHSPEIEISVDRRTATNRYNKDQELYTSTWKSVLGNSGVSRHKRLSRRRFNLRIDFNPYVVACGIAPGTANVNLDLSGSNPSLSLFSNGNYYAYPSEVTPLNSPTDDNIIFERFISSRFSTGDLISITVDMVVGVVEFRKNNAILNHYLLPQWLTDIEWFPAVTLSRDARITLLPDNSTFESLDLSPVIWNPMDLEMAKTFSTQAQ